jgi:hypothetical protein
LPHCLRRGDGEHIQRKSVPDLQQFAEVRPERRLVTTPLGGPSSHSSDGLRCRSGCTIEREIAFLLAGLLLIDTYISITELIAS